MVKDGGVLSLQVGDVRPREVAHSLGKLTETVCLNKVFTLRHYLFGLK